MGPYCNFCGLRCFKRTDKNSYVKTDLEATCKKGIIFDLDSTYSRILDKNKNLYAWAIEQPRHKEEFLAVQFLNDKIMEFSIKTSEIEEYLDLVNGGHYYKLIK